VSSEQAPARNAPHGKDAAQNDAPSLHLARLEPLSTFAGDLEEPKGAWMAMNIVPAPAKAPPASNSQVRLRELRPQSSRRWNPGHRARPSVGMARCCEKSRSREGAGLAGHREWCRASGTRLVGEEQALAREGQSIEAIEPL
jgi:hypothetical protein